MGYGFGLGVYESDYFDPEEPDNDWCNACMDFLENCTCPEFSDEPEADNHARVEFELEPPF